MQLSRRELVDQLLAFMGEEDDARARTLAETEVNLALERIWLRHDWRAFRSPVPHQFASVINQRGYALPAHFGRIGTWGKVRNVSLGSELFPLEPADVERYDPTYGTSLQTTGTPAGYFLAGTAGVSSQPTGDAGEECTVVSSSASDTTVLVSIEGERAAGREDRLQVTLNGITPVSIGTWRYIDSFSKAYPDGTDPATPLTSSLGTVTLKTATDLLVLGSLYPQESSASYPILNLYPTPNAAHTYAVPMLRRPKRLLYDADALPDGWGPALTEELQIRWLFNRGELKDPAMAARPCFLDLIANDNAQGPRRHTRPYMG